MTDSITPPPELVAKLWREASKGRDDAPIGEIFNHGVYLAYAAGADQELEACCEWVGCMFHGHKTWSDELRAARRPKPLSLKEQALDVLQRYTSGEIVLMDSNIETIRRALEQLDD